MHYITTLSLQRANTTGIHTFIIKLIISVLSAKLVVELVSTAGK
jgi:hypothetical protein